MTVHGFIVNSQSWKRGKLYYDLLTAGYRVITVDLRGNGRSDKPQNCDLYANDAGIVRRPGLIPGGKRWQQWGSALFTMAPPTR